MNKTLSEQASIKLTILSIMGDMTFKDNKERFEYAEWALNWTTPPNEVEENRNNITSLKGLN